MQVRIYYSPNFVLKYFFKTMPGCKFIFLCSVLFLKIFKNMNIINLIFLIDGVLHILFSKQCPYANSYYFVKITWAYF